MRRVYAPSGRACLPAMKSFGVRSTEGREGVGRWAAGCDFDAQGLQLLSEEDGFGADGVDESHDRV